MLDLEPLNEESTYTLKGEENKPEHERVVCTIKNISLQEHQNLVKHVYSNDTAFIEYNYDKALDFVTKIENLKVGGKDITTGAELRKTRAKGIKSIIREIVIHGVLADTEVES